jgi:hypothetical protein
MIRLSTLAIVVIAGNQICYILGVDRFLGRRITGVLAFDIQSWFICLGERQINAFKASSW